MSNDGKLTEGLVQAALKEMECKAKSTWVRLYDSKSAGFGSGGNIIPPQPCDFIYTLNGNTAALEVKSSEVALTLQDTTLRSMFKENQIQGARLWHRSGNKAICLFHSLSNDRFEVWDMQQIVGAYLAPPRKRQLIGPPLSWGSRASLCDMLYHAIM